MSDVGEAETTISQVFISHASQDVSAADKICRALEAAALPSDPSVKI
jgi:hypothetical protein